ncbi:MAG TPA: hypothetical protein VF507_05075 [Pyrinomonadaceae bacterium]|jgi:TolA-binding protein
MILAVLVLALALACVAGVQFLYMTFLQTVSRHDRRRVEELEQRLRRAEEDLEATSRELEFAEGRLAEALKHKEDAWPEIIDG